MQSVKAREGHTVIRYTDSLAAVTADSLQGFFERWPKPPSPETHLRLLAGSDKVVLAPLERWDVRTGNP